MERSRGYGVDAREHDVTKRDEMEPKEVGALPPAQGGAQLSLQRGRE